LKELRLHIGLKQQAVADRFGISRNFLSMIENGKKKCPLDLYEELINYYNLMNQTEGLEALFDYVRIRIPTQDVRYVVEQLLFMDFDLFYSKPTGLYGYIQVHEYDSIRVMESEKGDERGTLIELSGRGCRNYDYVLNELDHHWLDFFKRCLENDGVVRRIDLAIDDYVEYFTLDELVKKRKQKLFISSFRTSRVVETSDDENEENQGITMYFGSRSSLIHFCFYQKNYEIAKREKIPLEEIDVKNRYEVRLQKEKAQRFIENYLEDTWLLRSARSVIYQQLCFLEKNRYGALYEWSKWTRFIGATKYVDLSMKPIKPSFDRKFRWLKNYCGQSIYIMQVAGEQLGIDYLQQITNVEELNEANQKVLEWQLAKEMDLLSHEGRLIAKETGEIIS